MIDMRILNGGLKKKTLLIICRTDFSRLLNLLLSVICGPPAKFNVLFAFITNDDVEEIVPIVNVACASWAIQYK